MYLFTDSLKWDIFIVYIIISLVFVISCLILVSYLFVFYPAQSDLLRTKVTIRENPMIKRTSFVKSNPNLCFTPNQNDGLLCPENDIFRSSSCNNINFTTGNTMNEKIKQMKYELGLSNTISRRQIQK